MSVDCGLTCDLKKYSSGCEDTVGSFCNKTSGRCECRPEFNVILSDRFCLKSRALLESCFISNQCPDGSQCYSNSTELLSTNIQFWIRPEVPLFPEGLCVCPQIDFINKGNVCERLKSIGESCEEDGQCLQPNGVCNATTHQCVCNETFVYSSVIGHCVRGKYLGEECSGREECQYSEEYSWCSDNICMCGAGYTPDKASFNGMPQCVLDTMIVERVVPETVAHRTESSFDYMTLLLIFAFLIAFIIAIGIARRNRNSIMQMIRPSSDVNTTGYCDQSSHRMIPIDNTINSFNTSDIAINVDQNYKQNLHSNQLLPNISIESQKTY